jgi:hypothetical protein
MDGLRGGEELLPPGKAFPLSAYLIKGSAPEVRQLLWLRHNVMK